MSYKVSTTTAYGHSTKENTVVVKATASDFAPDFPFPRQNPDQSVEVAVTFDPETKQWKAEIVEQYEGRFV